MLRNFHNAVPRLRGARIGGRRSCARQREGKQCAQAPLVYEETSPPWASHDTIRHMSAGSRAKYVKLSARELTQEVKRTASLQDLLELHAIHKDSFNEIHASAAWQKIGRLQKPREWKSLAGVLDLERTTVRVLFCASARTVANVAHGAAHGKYFSSLLFHAVTKRAEQCLEDVEPQDATLGLTAPKLRKAVTKRAEERPIEFNPQGLANTVWAFATVVHAAPKLFNAVAKKAEDRLEEFNAQELANTVWAFATVGHPALRLFNEIAKRADERLEELNPQNLANTVWAFATVSHLVPYLFNAVAKRAEGRMKEFKPQELANIVRAYATVGHAAPYLFNAVAKRAEERLEEFNSQNLANTVWAFSTVNHAAPNLFFAVAKRAETRLGQFHSQELANTVWAFAKAGYAAPALFNAVAKRAEERVKELNPQELANTLWAFATVGHPALKLFNVLAKRAEERLEGFNPQNLANTVWAFATVGHAAPALFNAVAKRAEERVEKFKPQELANIAWAFATVGHTAPSLFDAVAKQIKDRLEEFNPQSLATTVWAFAVLNAQRPEIFDRAVVNKLESFQAYYRIKDWRQLHQWNLWQIELGMQPRLSAEMRKQCFQHFRSCSITKSNFQRNVMANLRKIGVAPTEEVQTGLGYSLDGAVTWHGCKIAIELDGPSHFIGHDPDGATMLKRRQLCSLGTIKLCSIPYWEWEACITSADMQGLLRKRLDLVLHEESPRLSKDDLKYRLKAFGVKVSGAKPELQERWSTWVLGIAPQL